MRKTHIIESMVFAAMVGMTSCSGVSEQVKMYGDKPMSEFLKTLTTEQKVNLVLGVSRGAANPPEEAPGMPVRHSHEAVTSMSKGRVAGAAADSYGVDSLGIPSIVFADGPAGLRIDPTRENETKTYYCTAFPTGTSLAASWDVEGVRKMATDMGDEVLEYGVDILLAPAINIHRNPLCGRNFEYYSEDPFLAGDIAAAYVEGIQSNGVGTSLKHFAVNNQETMRNGIDAQVSERALREIYLKGFERVVKKAMPWTIMSSYNKINGVLASENEWLLEDVLRKEWGFDGLVMTDWWAEENGARQEAAGNDLLMPGTQHQYDEVMEGLKNGMLKPEQLDRNVSRILDVVQRTPAFKGYKYSNNPDLTAHARTARKQAAQGMVLLDNKAETLPLALGQRIALFGNASYDTYVGGTGSGYVNRKYKVNISEGLQQGGYQISATVADRYGKYLASEKAKLAAENFWAMPDIKEMPLDNQLITQAIGGCDVVVMTLSRMAGEGGDRKLEKGDYFLSDVEKQNIQKLLQVAHAAGKKAVLLLNMGSIVELEFDGSETFDAVMHIWMPGQEAGHAVADVISGKVSPSGKLPLTWAKHYADYPSSKDFPLSEGSDRAVRYAEDVFVGYRHFDSKKVEPLYAFGHGLSYTTFAYSNMDVKNDGDGFKVTLTVQNTGKRAGAEVVQLYVGAPQGSMAKPVKELKAFAKTKVLAPGESATVELAFTKYDLASFEESRKDWVTASGNYTAFVAASSADIKISKDFSVK